MRELESRTSALAEVMQPQMRAERLLASGRAALALTALVVIWIDPAQPARYVALVYAVLAAYAVYAVTIALLAWRASSLPAGLPMVTHALDVLGFPALMFFTEGPGSPFFLYFVFALFAAATRWQMRGALLTAGFLICAYMGIGVLGTLVMREEGFAISTFVLRSTFLCVAAAITGAFAEHEHLVRREMLMMALWPRELPHSISELMRQSLAHAAPILRSRRALAVWEEGEEPWLQVASWNDGVFERTREPPGQWEPLVALPLHGAAFLCLDAKAPAPDVLVVAGWFVSQRLAPLNEDFRARFGIGSVLSAPLPGQGLTGRIFWLDIRGLAADDLVLADLIARQVTSRLDRIYVAERLRDRAAFDERVRIARDLHDGLLQSLTAAALEIEAVRSAVGPHSADAATQLSRVASLIAAEQRVLRWMIRDLKPGVGQEDLAGAPKEEVDARLRELARTVEDFWGAKVDLRTDGLPDGASSALAFQVYLLVSEALINAVRHGRASAVRVAVDEADGRIRIGVQDNGRGFSFRGHYPLEELQAQGLGPASLIQRVKALDGSLAIESDDSGAHLQITLPLQPPEA